MSDGNKPANPDRTPTGQFLPGNSIAKLGGRPTSSRQKLAEAFFRDMQAIWEANGPEVLRSVLDEKPGDLMRAVAGLMPKEMTVELTNHEDALAALEGDDDAESTKGSDPPVEGGLQGDTGSAKGTP